MGAGIFHLSYDPGPRCFSLSVRVLWSLPFAKDRITHPAAVGRSVQLLQRAGPAGKRSGFKYSRNNGRVGGHSHEILTTHC